MPSQPDRKVVTLREQGTLNPHPDRVRDELFQGEEFFDGRDLLQVKYEMIRRIRADRMPAAHVAALFGMSRPTLYKAMSDFDAGGMLGLRPRLRGPKGGYKLTAEALAFVLRERTDNPALQTSELAVRLAEQMGIVVHSRSIERALTRLKKKAAGGASGARNKKRVLD